MVRPTRRADDGAVDGTSRLSTRWPWRRAFVGLLTVGVLATIAVAWSLLSARTALNDGVRETRRVESELHLKQFRLSPYTALQRARDLLEKAHNDFHRADDRLSLLAPFLEHLSWIPSIGPDLSVAPRAARAADFATQGGVELLTGLEPLLKHMGRVGSAAHLTPPTLVRYVSSEHLAFASACTHLNAARLTRGTIAGGGSQNTARVLRAFDRRLPELQRACQALLQLPRILGLGRAATYLLAYQNAAELRATGGFIGSVGFLTAENGRIRPTFRNSGFSGFHDNLAYAPPDPIAVYEGEPAWLFRDSNWSPDFPTSAALERFFLRLDLHVDVSGVINVTPAAVAAILKAVGPVYSAEYHRWITSGNVAALADYFTHIAVVHGPLGSQFQEGGRKQFIGIVARHIMSRVTSLPLSQLPDFVNSLASSVRRGDLLANFSDASQQQLVEQAGASGRINPTPSDFLYVVDSNLSDNKINDYVHSSVTYSVTIQRNCWLQGHLTIRIHNTPAPPQIAKEGNGPDFGRRGGRDDYADFVRVYVPAGALLGEQSGWLQTWSEGPAYGKTMFSGYIIVHRGETRTVRLQYLIPPNVLTPAGGRAYRIVVQHQPGSNPDFFAFSLTDRTGRHFSFKDVKPTADAAHTVEIRPCSASPIPLPRSVRPTVAPGQEIEPHTRLVHVTNNGV